MNMPISPKQLRQGRARRRLAARRSSASPCCCRAAARSAPIRPASTRRWPRPNLHPDWVAGISIGAINAALIAGNPPEARASRSCARSGRAITSRPLGALGRSTAVELAAAISRAAGQPVAARIGALLCGAPGFFAPRMLPPLSAAGRQRRGDELLRHHAAARRRSSGWSISTASTPARCASASARSTSRTGNFVYFDNSTHKIRPEHIMASGALPPGFPPIEIDGEHLLGRRPRLQHAAAMGARQPAAPGHAGLPGRSVERARRAAARSGRGRERGRRKSAIRAARAPSTDQFKKRTEAAPRARRPAREAARPSCARRRRLELLRAEADDKVYNIIQLIYRSQAATRASRRTTSSRAARMEEHWPRATTTRCAPCAIRRCWSGRAAPTACSPSISPRTAANDDALSRVRSAMKMPKSASAPSPCRSPARPIRRARTASTTANILVITYRTDPEKLRAWCRSRSRSIEPLVKFEFIRMPDSTGFGDYTETGQVIPVALRGPHGRLHATACSSTTTRRSPAAASSGAFPRSSPNPKLRAENDTLVGTLDYGPVRVAPAPWATSTGRSTPTRPLAALAAPNFLLKIIPHVDGTPRICELVEYYLEDVHAEGRVDRPRRVVAPCRTRWRRSPSCRCWRSSRPPTSSPT